MTGSDSNTPLAGLRVVDLSSGIPGGYCTKLLADAGADVVKLEDPAGDALRSWRSSGRPVPDGTDGALFRFLGGSKRSVVVGSDDVTRALAWIDAADAVVWSAGSALAAHPDLAPEALVARRPEMPLLSLSPYGRTGPWRDAPATEFTLQGWAGGMGVRGEPDRPPVSIGGRSGEWIAGLMGAVSLLSSCLVRDQGTGGGLLDCSILESLVITHTMHTTTYRTMAGKPQREVRSLLFPGLERTSDGWVAVIVSTGQQWLDFCTMLERWDWLEDESLGLFVNRAYRRAELGPKVTEWTTARTTAEVLELASAFRIPVAPVCNGATVIDVEQFRVRELHVEHPGGGFLQPAVSYRLHGDVATRPFGAAPALGADSAVAPPPPVTACASVPDPRPLAGLRVVEFTGFWAGPIPGWYLALLGADVIHVESPKRPDGMRFSTARPLSDPHWCEYSASFYGGNTNKRSLTLDLDTGRGLELARALIAECDVVVENFSPRVMEHWGFTYDQLSVDHPDLVMVRGPAYGLTGPWRDRVGYAQTLESASGMSWLTGYPDADPQMPNGPCDPIAGYHATFALLTALEHRRRTGRGMLVESPTIGGVLNVAGEQVVEYTAYGNLLNRTGNRSHTAVPQGAYLSSDLDERGRRDCWVAIAVETDPQWAALSTSLGRPEWTTELATVDARRARVEEIDEVVAGWCRDRSTDEIVAALWAVGVPAAGVVMPHLQDGNPQLAARGFFEAVEHPIVGPVVSSGFPVRAAWRPGPWHRTSAPAFGAHNREILTERLGLTDAEVDELEAAGVISSVPFP